MEWLSVAPPVAAILVAVTTRNVYWALGTALWLSETLIANVNPAAGALGAVDRAVGVFESPGNTRILLFCLLIGALIAYMRDSGGVDAMVRVLTRSGVAGSRRRASAVTAAAGTAIFVDTNASLLSAGVLGRSLFDAHRLSRARLAYIIDSTSAPVSVLILINGWGAYALSLVAPYGFASPIGVVAGSIAWNAYAWLTLAGVYATVVSDRVFGPLAAVERASAEVGARPAADPVVAAGIRAGAPRYMWAPLLTLVAGAIAFMAWTGGGNIMAGSGSQSILWAMVVATGLAYAMLARDRVFALTELQDRGFQGIGEMVPAVTVLFFSIALGDSLRVLGTGEFIAALAATTVAPAVIPGLLFVAAAATSFTTGTSWGTYGVMIPIAMPLAQTLGLPPSLILAAVLGGGVFGDHCSPISDTTLIASIASGADHLEHVRTQLPYALAAAAGAMVVYGIAGVVVTAQG